MADPYSAGISSLLALFDPKVAAEGAALQARTRNFDAESRYNAARAAAVEDQNAILTEDAMIRAGITDPIERATRRATRSNSVADVFRGRNLNQGSILIKDPATARQGALLLGEGAAASNPNSVFTQQEAADSRQQKIDAELNKASTVANINGQSRIAAAMAAASTRPAKVDPNTLPFEVKDPAQDLVRMLGVTDENGGFTPPSEEEVVQPTMSVANALLANKLTTRQDAINDALAVRGFLPKKNVVKASKLGGWGTEYLKTVNAPAPAPVLDAHGIKTEGDVGEVIEVPDNNIGMIHDPSGPVMNALPGAIVKIGNAAYVKVVDGNGQQHLQRVR